MGRKKRTYNEKSETILLWFLGGLQDQRIHQSIIQAAHPHNTFLLETMSAVWLCKAGILINCNKTNMRVFRKWEEIPMQIWGDDTKVRGHV